MKLRNKETGEIREIKNILIDGMFNVKSLAELADEWEDYEEPKEYWFVDSGGEVEEATYLTDNDKSSLRNFGNYFETREEAEKAVEKLKAWKRLKDKGFKFNNWNCPFRELYFVVDEEKFFKASGEISEETEGDLGLLFGGGDD